MTDGISKHYTDHGRAEHERIFKKDVINQVPHKIKDEIRKLNETEARLERRRKERFKPKYIENMESKIEDDRQKF